MNVDFVPTFAVTLSLCCCIQLPIALFVLSHRPLRIPAPGKRFVVAIGLTWAAWVAAMVLAEPDSIDLIAGGLLLATASLVYFTLWTLIAWGFTLSMLLALFRAGQPLTADEWATAYTRGKPFAAFAEDRLGVLFRLGLADLREDQVAMTAWRGRAFASVAILLRKLFGLPS
jgi:hypothetical protein